MSQIAYWAGKSINEMSREELIEALNQSADSYNRLLISSQAERKFWSGLLKAKTKRKFRLISFLERLVGRKDESS